MKKNIHTSRINFALSPILKQSIDVASHANLMSISEYIRSLVIDDLIKNSELEPLDVNNKSLIQGAKAVYISRHDLP
jgi:hypothetical protein